MDDIVRVIKTLENSVVLIDGVSETVNPEIKQQEGGFLSMFLESLGASMLGNILTKNSSRVMRAGKLYNNMDHMNKNF